MKELDEGQYGGVQGFESDMSGAGRRCLIHECFSRIYPCSS